VIPRNIIREHVWQAAAQIDTEGVPTEREPKEYPVIVDGKRYPLMYVVSLANKFANGEELEPRVFGPGEAIRRLIRLGFQIKPIES
jgi:hypothetical protein